jgi:glycosyltransferase involved in cell wall biosynthesis
LYLSIVIPAYNEERRIGSTLQEYLDFYSSIHGNKLEVLVVLNGCQDGTEEVVLGLRRSFPQLKSVVFSQRLGKGGAVLQGLRRTHGELVAFVDADNMVGPLETAKLVGALEKWDIAIGSRSLEDDGAQPRIRRLVSKGTRWWIRRFLGLRYQDTQCGAKALRGQVARQLAALVTETGWAFDLDLLVSAEAMGFSVTEIPVVWNHVQEDSKVDLLRDGPGALRAALRIRRKRLESR